jgi:GNAT superfamily N-acetyltransferase
MPDITIALVKTEAEIGAVRQLCRQWPAWLLETFPENEEGIRKRFYSGDYEDMLAALPEIHARPKGAMFLATLDEAPAGCVMYHENGSGQAEFNRMFVATFARGHRLGERLMVAMLEQMKSDGYQTVVFNSARFLEHARRMYERLGFRDIPVPPGRPAPEYHMMMDLGAETGQNA